MICLTKRHRRLDRLKQNINVPAGRENPARLGYDAYFVVIWPKNKVSYLYDSLFILFF